MPDSDLAGRVTLLTGASGGIGVALGRRLIAARARVAFTYHRHADEAEQLATEATAAGLDSLLLAGDLADPDAPTRMLRETAGALGPVDVLIPNAGYSRQQEYADVDLDTWDRTLAVNLRAPFLFAQSALPGMIERGFGRVLFVSSVAGFTVLAQGDDPLEHPTPAWRPMKLRRLRRWGEGSGHTTPPPRPGCTGSSTTSRPASPHTASP